MNLIDESDLIMWKESPGRYRFQTNSSKSSRQMKGRNSFQLTAESLNSNFWIYYCDLPNTKSALSRFKGLTGRKPIYDISEEIYY